MTVLVLPLGLPNENYGITWTPPTIRSSIISFCECLHFFHTLPFRSSSWSYWLLVSTQALNCIRGTKSVYIITRKLNTIHLSIIVCNRSWEITNTDCSSLSSKRRLRERRKLEGSYTLGQSNGRNTSSASPPRSSEQRLPKLKLSWCSPIFDSCGTIERWSMWLYV